MRRIAIIAIGALGIGICADRTHAQGMDSTLAAAPTPAPSSSRSGTIYDVWLGVARNSPTNLFSGIAGRRLTISALHVQRPFAASANAAWDYVAGLVPVAWISATPHKGRGEQPDGCQFPQGCALIIENQRRVHGFGVTPAGLQLRLSPSANVQPFLSIEAGALWFNESMPTTRADRFNFMLDAGGGLLFARPGKLGFVLGYKLVHISNGGLGPVNPGLDNHLLYAGLTRVPAAGLTTRSEQPPSDEPSEDSPVGSARVALDWRTYPYSKDLTSWSGSGAVMPFVSRHWQLGVVPLYVGSAVGGRFAHHIRLAGAANLMTGGNEWKAYVGGLLGGEGGTYESGTGLVGAQVGALRFLGPAAALRTELRWRRSTYAGSVATADAFITLDSYIGGRASVPASLPTLGTFDVAGVAYANFRFERERSYSVTVAPFLTSWSQLGADLHHASFESAANGRIGAGSENIFARFYAPVSPRFSPFSEAFVEHSTYADANPNRWLSTYGAAGGARHAINAGTALDVALQWRRHTRESSASGMIRARDESVLQVRLTTQVRLGQSPR